MKNDTCLGIEVSHMAASLVAIDARNEIIHSAFRMHSGRPLETVDELMGELLEDCGEIDRALITGVGSALVSRHLACNEVGGPTAAVAAAAIQSPSAKTVISLDAESAFLASVPSRTGYDFGPTDVRQASPCAIGIGWFLDRCAPKGSASVAFADLEETVSCRCAQVAQADIAALKAAGKDEEYLGAQAVRAAARILLGGVLGGGGIEGPVILLGASASTPGLAQALQQALSLPPGSVVVPKEPELSLALGAARLAASLGKKPDLTRAGPAETRPALDEKDGSGKKADAAISLEANWALEISATASRLLRIKPDTQEVLDAASANVCRRALGQALPDMAEAMGLADAHALGRLASEASRGSWLRDRCPETLRMDAQARLVSGDERSAVARGILEAIARGMRRGLTQKWSPKGNVLLMGEFASVPGLTDALGRAFGCEFHPSETGVAQTNVIDSGAPDEDTLGPDLLAEREELLLRHTSLNARGTRLGTMGLPLSLGMADNIPFWSRFLAEVGFDVHLLGRNPSHDEISRAAARTAGEPCSAAISARGEIEALASEKEVNAIFLPIEVDSSPLQKPEDGKQAPIVYRCPFLQATAYLAGCELRIVRPILFRSFSEGMSERSMVGSLSPWRIAPGAVKRAMRVADIAQIAFERALQKLGTEAIASLGNNGRAVVLLGRQYSSRLLSSGVRKRLRSGGVAIIPQDVLPLSREDIADSTKEMYWDSGQRILSAARTVARDSRLGAVYLTHTRCGPDSFVKKYAHSILQNKPWALMELSGQHHCAEQEAQATLFRACWDAAYAAGLAPASIQTKPDAEEPRPTNKPTVYFPDMGAASAAGVAALGGFDISAEVVRADEDSLRAAACHTSGDECLPYIITIGNLAKTLDGEKFDPAKTAFFMASSSGSCRFGQFRRGFRQVLDSLDMEDIRVISLNQSEGHTKQMPGFAFARLLWQGMTALGEIDRAGLHIRPRSADPRSVDEIIAESREDVLGSLRKRIKPRGALLRSAERFNSVAMDEGAAPVKIAITGEIFVRSQPFTNSNLVHVIEEAGGEAVVPPFQEWIYHVNKCVGLFARARGKTIGVWGLRAALAFLRRGEKKSQRALRLTDPPPSQPPLEEIWQRAHAAGFIPWFGDASLALGRALSLRDSGARGVVNIVPYGCEPGVASEAVFAQRRRVLAGIPVLHLHLDGGPEVEVRSKVRALVDAARSYAPHRGCAPTLRD